MNSSKEPKLVWVENLRQELILPGRIKPITRPACDRLINKWDRTRIKTGTGQKARAYISEELAEKVKEYFRLKHKH